MPYSVIEVLLVEDDPVDVELTLDVMRTSKLRMNINTVADGQEAMDYLLRQGKYKNKPIPDLILLDLNLPRKSGQEVLREIKTYNQLKHIPIVILTTSSANEDIVQSYAAGANCYVTKPVGLAEFKNVVASIEDFWFTIVKLPKE